MNIIKKIIKFFNNMFHKDKIKKIEEFTYESSYDERSIFKKSLEIHKEKEIETLICKGDGLGIQKKITY